MGAWGRQTVMPRSLPRTWASVQAAAEVRWSGWLVHSWVKRVHLATGLQKGHFLSYMGLRA